MFISCDYKLSGSASWQVNLKMDRCETWSSCVKTLKMTFGSNEVTATGSKIDINGQRLDEDANYVKGGNLKLKKNINSKTNF